MVKGIIMNDVYFTKVGGEGDIKIRDLFKDSVFERLYADIRYSKDKTKKDMTQKIREKITVNNYTEKAEDVVDIFLKKCFYDALFEGSHIETKDNGVVWRSPPTPKEKKTIWPNSSNSGYSELLGLLRKYAKTNNYIVNYFPTAAKQSMGPTGNEILAPACFSINIKPQKSKKDEFLNKTYCLTGCAKLNDNDPTEIDRLTLYRVVILENDKDQSNILEICDELGDNDPLTWCDNLSEEIVDDEQQKSIVLKKVAVDVENPIDGQKLYEMIETGLKPLMERYPKEYKQIKNIVDKNIEYIFFKPNNDVA